MTQSYVDSPTPAAALLQLARLKAGLSQRQLAERADVPTTMISAYERDRRQPTLPTLLRLLRAAGFDLRMWLEPYEAADDDVAVLDGRQEESWRRASRVVDHVEIVVEDLDDVIRSKELAGRPKDLRVLPTLYRFRADRLGS
jgi:transcriptional regulator with XRE-family HTH domain